MTISIEEVVRSQYALQIAMDVLGAKNINSFCTALADLRALEKKTNTNQERVVRPSQKNLEARQEQVANQITEIEKVETSKANSTNSKLTKKEDNKKDVAIYWEKLVNPIRFHRIFKGKGSSNIPEYTLRNFSEASGYTTDEGTVFDIKNIWYFLKPYVGERAYFAYKFGPHAFYHNDKFNLWNLLFGLTHPDDLIKFDSIFNPFQHFSNSEKLLSSEEMSKVLIDHYRKLGSGVIKTGYGYSALLYTSVIMISENERKYRDFDFKYSQKLKSIFIKSKILQEAFNKDQSLSDDVLSFIIS